MKLFITGATGFIGLHLVRALLEEGHEVLALVRNPARVPRDLDGRIELLVGDLSIFRDPDIELPQVDVVVHLAAVVAGRNDAEYAEINHRAVVDLLDAIDRQSWRPRRFLFASSLAAAGPSKPPSERVESDSDAPIDPYGAAKLAAEACVAERAYATTIFRPCIVLGPGDPASLTLYKVARTGLALRPAGASQQLSFVDVADLVTGIVAMARDESDADRVYFVAHDRSITTDELYRVIGDALGKRVRILPVPRPLLRLVSVLVTALARVLPIKNQLDRKQVVQMFAPAWVCSSRRLQDDSGWRPQVDLDECARRAVAGYRRQGQL